MTAPWHFGIPHAGRTYEWLPTDTEENFQQLMQEPEHRKYFGSKGWDQPGSITYKINSHGFRSEEFDPAAPSICLLYTSPSPRDRTRSRMPSSA